jgi:hypothetical protein
VSEDGGRVEPLLERLFAPVDPPADLATRIQTRLRAVSESAAEELDGWELASMRDPRNWGRPAIAVLAGGVAGAGLVLLGLHQRQRRRRD